MPICAFCKSEETQLHLNGTPICLRCEEKRKPPQTAAQIHHALVGRVADAAAKVSAANDKFNDVMNRFLADRPIPTACRTSRMYRENCWSHARK